MLQRLSSMELYFVEVETVYVVHFDDVNVPLDIRQDNNNSFFHWRIGHYMMILLYKMTKAFQNNNGKADVLSCIK